ncbi:MAG: hypothetical protein D3905_02965 [Candidatus Electrothrix sp. AS4_5]|nr:hypothetical protein [Candidatus Electrothrix gigas]MCI5188761.1 hypothetical protein [Candidatus Electrothrix gigas]
MTISDKNTCTYIVDICGTLVRDDTTLGLLQHHFARHPRRNLRYWFYRVITAHRSPLRLSFVVLEKITRRHLLKYFAIRLLTGDTIKALNQSATEYAALLLTERRIPAVWQILEEPLKSKKPIVLASASLEPIVAALANSMGVHYIASKLEKQNGFYTGRYTLDITGDKVDVLKEKYNEICLDEKLYVISDNITDLNLLKKAKHAYVVLHKESHHQRWNGINATFLKVDE